MTLRFCSIFSTLTLAAAVLVGSCLSLFAADGPADAGNKADTAQKYDLRYKFQPGEQIRTRVVHQATVRTTIDGSSQTAATVSESVKRWKVQSVDAKGLITFVHSVEHVNMRNDVSGREPAHYDSRTDAKAPAGFQDVSKRVGVPLTLVTMDPRGKILKREEKTTAAPGQGNQLTLPLPDHPVAIGESWNFPSDMRITMRSGETRKIQARQHFTLDSVADDVAKIKVETQILTPVSDPEVEAQLIESQTAGTIRFDISAGRMLGQQVDLDRSVVGYPDPKSSMHYRTRFTEELLPASERTADQHGPQAPRK
ncbi:MAG: hypothetical protein K8T25_04395 [Planctomycetia bacterium]|nr:hypothetical protein [Planctomycetia bacterium]